MAAATYVTVTDATVYWQQFPCGVILLAKIITRSCQSMFSDGIIIQWIRATCSDVLNISGSGNFFTKICPTRRSDLKRQLAAILSADVIASARLMSTDEEGSLERIRGLQKDVIEPAISLHEGRVVKYMGDGALAEFPSVVNAVQAATEIIEQNISREQDQAEDRRIRLRIGVNLGDIISEDGDIYGDGVNVAARLEALADPDGLCISGIAYQGLGTVRSHEFTDSGPYEVKNIKKPVRVYRWRTQARQGGAEQPEETKPTISIAPFSYLPEDDALHGFAAGLEEDIAVAIGTVEQLTVIDETKAVETPRYRLSASVRGSGERLRIQAKLVDQFSGVQVWAQRFDRTNVDYFDLQDELAQTIVISVHTTLGAGTYTNRWQRGTNNFEAWRLSAQAFNIFQKYSPDAMDQCIEIWNEACLHDPEFPTPRIARSYCRARKALWSSPELAKTLLDAADEDLQAAQNLADETDSRTNSLARAINIARGDHEGAIEVARQGFAREPGNPATRATLAYALVMAGRNEEALEEILKSTADIKNYPGWFATIKILSNFFMGDIQSARAEAERIVQRQPDFYPGRPLLVACHVESEAMEAARSVAADIKARDSKFSVEVFVASLGLKNKQSQQRIRSALTGVGL